MKTHPVIERLQQLKFSELKWLTVFSTFTFFSIVLASLLFLCVTDFYLRSDSAFLRLVQFSILMAVVFSGVAKFLLPLRKYRRSLIDVAKAVEKRHPELGTQVSLAADFLNSSRNNGSERFREVVIDRAEDQLTKLSLTDMIHKDWPIRAILLFTSVLVICTAFYAVNPADSSFALARTVSPLSRQPWPSFNELALEELPEKIAIGDDLLCTAFDRKGRLPRSITLEIDDGNGVRRRSMTREQNRAFYKISNAANSLKLRAVGGDDKTDWHSVEVVRPPEIKTIHVEVSPPKYSQLPRYVSLPFQKVWEGSEVRIRGVSTDPISSANFVLLSNADPSDGILTDLPFAPDRSIAQLLTNQNTKISKRAKITSATGIRFPPEGNIRLEQSVSFKIELTNRDKIVGGRNRTFQLPVRKDEAPLIEVQNLNPRSLYSLTDALHVQIKASDDMQLKSIHSLLELDGRLIQKEEVKLPKLVPQAATSSSRSEFSHRILFAINSVSQAKPNSEIQIRFEVRDVKGNSAVSNSVVARIGTDQDLKRLDAQQRKKIYESISQALHFQESSRNLNLWLQDQHRNQLLDAGSKTQFTSFADSQDKVESTLYAPNGALELLDRYLSSTFVLQDEQAAQRKLETANAAQTLRAIKDEVRSASLQANEAAAFSDELELAVESARKVESAQLRIVETLRGICGSIDEQTRYQGALAELKSLLGRQRILREETISLQTRSLGTAKPQQISTEAQRLANEQKGISTKLNEIGWGLLNDAKSLDSKPLKLLSDRIALIEIESKSVAAELTKGQFGLAIESIDKLIKALLNELNSDSISLLGQNAPTQSEIRGALKELNSIAAAQADIRQEIPNWQDLSADHRQKLREKLAKLKSRLAQFGKQNRPLLSDQANQQLSALDSLLAEIDQLLRQNRSESAASKMDEVQDKLSMIGAEIENKSRQADRLARNERFKQLQIDFANWLELQTKIGTAIAQSDSQNRDEVFAELLPLQASLSRDITSCKTQNSDLFALEIELTKLETNSRKVESAIQNRQQPEALAAIANVSEQLNRLCNERVHKTPEKESPQKTEEQPSQEQPTTEDEIQISEFEVQLIRSLQEKILTETKEIELRLQDKSIHPQEKARLTKETLALADRQAELISTMQKYLTPHENQNKSSVPDIPKIQDEIPELPDFEIDCGDSFGGSLAATQEESTAPRKQPADQDRDRNKQIEAVAPFAKEGEDIGEKSNSARNRLAKIREKMDEVHQLLINQRLSNENQDVQREIIKELDLFLTDKQKQSKDSSQQQKEKKNSKQGENAATNSDSNQKPKSTVDKENPGENARIQKRIDEIWGHLPENVSRKELNIRSEHFLPKYRDLIKEYFKRLANEPAIQ